jgi:hypothetical protein
MSIPGLILLFLLCTQARGDKLGFSQCIPSWLGTGLSIFLAIPSLRMLEMLFILLIWFEVRR